MRVGLLIIGILPPSGIQIENFGLKKSIPISF